MGLAVRFSQNHWVSNCYRVWQVYFASILNYLTQTLDCPSPRDFPCIIQSRYFSYLLSMFLWDPWLLHMGTLSLLSPFLFTPSSHGQVSSYSLWTLPNVPACDYALPHIYNKLSPLPHLGGVMFFLFFYFHIYFLYSSVKCFSTLRSNFHQILPT